MSYQRTPKETVCSNCGQQHVRVSIDSAGGWVWNNVEPSPCDNYDPMEVGRTQQDTWGDDDGILKW